MHLLDAKTVIKMPQLMSQISLRRRMGGIKLPQGLGVVV